MYEYNEAAAVCCGDWLHEINYRFGDFTTSPSANYTNYKKTMLSQGELRDADVNFDTYRILQ